jgi:hypothetical protein
MARPRCIAVGLGVLAVVSSTATAAARADDGPLDALDHMLGDSPTLTIVTSGVVVIADASATTIDAMDAFRGTSSERGFYAMELAIAAPQAAGFSLAPYFFHIDRWSPAENLLLLLPFQAWSTALATHGAWSLASTSLPSNARLGVSFLVGANWALTTTAIGCASWGDPSPLEVAVTEVGVGGSEAIFSFVRAAGDETHTVEWVLLGTWSSLILAHGIVSLVDAPSADTDERPASARAAPFAAPYATPVEGGAVAGVSGLF